MDDDRPWRGAQCKPLHRRVISGTMRRFAKTRENR